MGFNKLMWRLYKGMKLGWKKVETRIKILKYKRINVNEIIKNADELFITNNFGGGTKHFETNYINKRQDKIVVMRFCEYIEDLYIELERGETTACFPISTFQSVLDYKFRSIIVNTLVGCNAVKDVLEKVIEAKTKSNCKVEYMMHDFNAICINCNLFVDQGYCGLDCEKNLCNLKTYDEKKTIDIKEWRKMWSGFFEIVDQVNCFSESSENIVLLAYPFIAEKLITKPHDTSYIKQEPIDMTGKEFHIGFVGDCSSEFKGLQIVNKTIELYAEEIPITIVGPRSIYYRMKGKANCTGKYKRNDLKNVLENEGITHIIFPSLWPETFSYVVSELIALDVPIICFDYGAQAEKVRAYSKGTVVKNVDELLKYINTKRATYSG